MVDFEALVLTIAKGLVTHPEDVRLVKEDVDGVQNYSLTVHPEDMGRVIGRRGSTITALRTLVRAAASKAGLRVALDIVEQ